MLPIDLIDELLDRFEQIIGIVSASSAAGLPWGLTRAVKRT